MFANTEPTRTNSPALSEGPSDAAVRDLLAESDDDGCPNVCLTCRNTDACGGCCP